jgi:hypothetical protein
MKQTLQSIGVLSCAKIMGAVYFGLGLLFVPFLLIGAWAGTLTGAPANMFGSLALVIIGVLAPIFYGLIGFLMGAFSAFIYNLFAGWFGGIELVLQAPPVAAMPVSSMPAS